MSFGRALKEYLAYSLSRRVVAKVYTGVPGTVIPTSVALVGDYTTKLEFQSTVIEDIPNLVDSVNSRINIPSGYRRCKITYNLAWAGHAVGWRGCRVKNSGGQNYGNVRIPTVGADATTNNNFVSSWINISTNTAPNSIAAGGYLEFWPAHTAGVDLVCGADLASSFIQVEFER